MGNSSKITYVYCQSNGGPGEEGVTTEPEVTHSCWFMRCVYLVLCIINRSYKREEEGDSTDQLGVPLLRMCPLTLSSVVSKQTRLLPSNFQMNAA